MPNTQVKDQLTPFGPVPASQRGVCGREEEGPTVVEKALDGSRYRVHRAERYRRGCRRSPRTMVGTHGTVCSHQLSRGAQLRGASPQGCCLVAATMLRPIPLQPELTPLQQPAASRPRWLRSRAMTTVFRDERRPKLDPT